jgi:hypothetical protein
MTLADHAIAYRIPAEEVGTTKPVHIRLGSAYSSDLRPGWFVYQFLAPNNICGMYHNGTWDKYGEPFDTAEEALEAVRASQYTDRYDRWQEQGRS